MTDEQINQIVDAQAAGSKYCGLGSGTFYGNYAAACVRAALEVVAQPAEATPEGGPSPAPGAVELPPGLSCSDAESWLRKREEIIDALRAEGLTMVTTLDGVRFMRLGKIEAQAATSAPAVAPEPVALTFPEIRDLVRDAGLNWQNGWVTGPSEVNLYLKLVRSVERHCYGISKPPAQPIDATLTRVGREGASMTQLKVKRLTPGAQLPKYATEGAACFDIHVDTTGWHESRKNVGVDVTEHCPVTFSTGLAFEVPDDHVMLVFSRSGHGFKEGLRLANCVGVIDSDYRGELKVRLTKDGAGHPHINAGDRIAQAMILPIPKVQIIETDELSSTERGEGGFGSTGR